MTDANMLPQSADADAIAALTQLEGTGGGAGSADTVPVVWDCCFSSANQQELEALISFLFSPPFFESPRWTFSLLCAYWT